MVWPSTSTGRHSCMGSKPRVRAANLMLSRSRGSTPTKFFLATVVIGANALPESLAFICVAECNLVFTNKNIVSRRVDTEMTRVILDTNCSFFINSIQIHGFCEEILTLRLATAELIAAPSLKAISTPDIELS